MEDRRKQERYTFSATAEVVDLASGAHLATRAADLNKGGCYLDMLTPLPIGAHVRVHIQAFGAEFKCAAVVRDSQPGMGMGVAFASLDDAQKSLIESWIEKLSSPTIAGLSASPVPETAKPQPLEQRGTLVVKLIDLLYQKGLLSSSDVSSLLRDRDL